MEVRERRWSIVEASQEAEDRATYVISVPGFVLQGSFLPLVACEEEHSPK